MKKRRDVYGLFVLIAATTLLALPCHAANLVLVDAGRANSVIVTAAEPTRAAAFAAAELQYHLQKMTGAVIPIANDAAPGNAPVRILVGESALTREMRLRNDDFAPQEYLVAFRPQVLVLMGRDADDRGAMDYNTPSTFPGHFAEQGTAYAVYDFLEKFCGVRWFLPTELGEDIPRQASLLVWGDDIRRKPAMLYRFVYMSDAMPADFAGDTIEREKVPAMMNQRDQQLYLRRMRNGGEAYNANHSFYGYYDRFLEQHPEWFAQGYEGRPPQMCFTHPGFIDQVVKDAREYFDTGHQYPNARAAGNYFPLVPMDNASWCKCDNCSAEIPEKADRGGELFSNDLATEHVFRFINKVAREVGKTNPDKWLAALAYWDYAYPPRTEPLEENVSIMLCLHTRNLHNPEIIANDWKMLDTWTRESVERPKFVWLYYCFPSLVARHQGWRPFPGFFAHSVVDHFKRFHRSGVKGFFIEPSYLAHGQRSALMDQLELYVTWKLADDPTVDGNKLIDEFFSRYYGPAAAPMKELYVSMERTYADPSNWPADQRHQTAAIAWENLGTEERMQKWSRLLFDARRLARTQPYRDRVMLFDRGVFRWMEYSRDIHTQRAKLWEEQVQSVDVPRIASVGGDAAKVNWDAAGVLGNWSTLMGEPTSRDIHARMAHDGEYLYVMLQEADIDTSKIVLGDAVPIWHEDEWEVFFARERGPQYRQMGLNAAGVHIDLAYDEPSRDWDSGVILHSDISAPDRWVVHMALPLNKLVVGGARAGDTLYFNVIRATQTRRAVAWSPTFGGFREPRRMGEINLAP